MATKIKTHMLFDPVVLLEAAPTAAFTHVWDHAWSHSLQPYSWAEKLDITYVCLHKPRAKHTTSSPTGYHTPTEKERSTKIYGRNLRVVTSMQNSHIIAIVRKSIYSLHIRVLYTRWKKTSEYSNSGESDGQVGSLQTGRRDFFLNPHFFCVF